MIAASFDSNVGSKAKKLLLTEDMAHSVTTAERHILNHKVVHGSFDRFLCKIKVPGVIFASKSAVGLKINVKVPK